MYVNKLYNWQQYQIFWFNHFGITMKKFNLILRQPGVSIQIGWIQTSNTFLKTDFWNVFECW